MLQCICIRAPRYISYYFKYTMLFCPQVRKTLMIFYIGCIALSRAQATPFGLLSTLNGSVRVEKPELYDECAFLEKRRVISEECATGGTS